MLSYPQGVVRYTAAFSSAVNLWCFCSRENDVIRFAYHDAAPDGSNDVLFAHCAVRRSIICETNIIAEGSIICP